MANTGSTETTSHAGVTTNGSFGESLNTINGSLECESGNTEHRALTVARLEKYCEAALRFEVALLSFDGCTILQDVYDSCIAGGHGTWGSCASCDIDSTSPSAGERQGIRIERKSFFLQLICFASLSEPSRSQSPSLSSQPSESSSPSETPSLSLRPSKLKSSRPSETPSKSSSPSESPSLWPSLHPSTSGSPSSAGDVSRSKYMMQCFVYHFHLTANIISLLHFLKCAYQFANHLGE